MDMQLNPYLKLINWDGDFIVPEDTDAVLTSLNLVDADAVLCVEDNATAIFI